MPDSLTIQPGPIKNAFGTPRIARMHTQRAQCPVTKEYAINHIKDHYIIEAGLIIGISNKILLISSCCWEYSNIGLNSGFGLW